MNTKMNHITRIFCLLLALFSVAAASAQDSRAYDLATDKNGDLRKDVNGNAIDFSAVSSLISGNAANQNTQTYNLPFNVVFLGKLYKSFMIGTSGYLVLGNTDDGTQPFQFPTANANTFKLGNNNYRFQGVIAPFWELQTAKSIKYTTVGAAPNRAFVVEWVSYLPSAATPVAGYESNYQVRIYENNGVVEFVYGKMTVPTGNTTAVNATIGIARNSAQADYNFLAVADLDSFKPARRLTEYTTGVDNLYNKADTGEISPLNYDNDSTARRLTFTPDAVYAPNNLTAITIFYDSAILYWDDNSANEVVFELQKKDRFGNWQYYDTTTAGVNFYLARGFYPGEVHQFRVRVYNQGRYSGFSNVYTLNIPAPQAIEAVKSGNWTDPATWSTNAIPTRYDSVYIGNGYEVSMSAADGKAFHVVVDSGALRFENTSQARQLSIFGSLWVNKNGAFTMANTPLYDNTTFKVLVRGDVVNKGIIDLHKYDAVSYKAMGAKLSFFNNGISIFTSDSGTVTDLHTLAVERTKITDSVFFHPYSVTVHDYATDAQSNMALTDVSAWVGTLVVDGSFTIQNRFFPANATVGDNAGLWLNNNNLAVYAQNGNLTFNGSLHVSKGIINIGNDPANIVNGSFDLLIDGGELNIGGRLNSTNATSYTQTGGKLRVAKVGNNTTEPSMGIAATAVVQMLGGEIVVVQPGTSTSRTDYNVQSATNSVFGGTLVRLTENTKVTNGREFVISGNFPNLLVDSAANSTEIVKVRLGIATRVYGNFTLSANDSLDLNPAYLYLYGSITNNGRIYSTTTSGAVVLAGDTQILSGPGVINTPRLEMFQLNPTSTFTLPADSLVQTTTLNLTRGTVINGKYLQLGDSLKNITIEVGRTGTRYEGAALDSFPHLVQGIGTYNLQYINLGKKFATGYEIPASRRLATFSINSDSAVIISGGALEVMQTLTLTKGIIITDSVNKIRVTNMATAAVSGGSTLTYIQGPLARKIAPKLSAATYVFPVGAATYNPLTLANLYTDSLTSEVTAQFNNGSFTYTAGKGVTLLDSTFGYWIAKADSNVKNITAFGASVNYKTTNDGFIRLAVGKTTAIGGVPALDSAGTKANATATVLTGNGLAFDTAKTVIYIAAAEYRGDTLYNNVFKVGKGKDFENLTAVSRRLSSAYIAGNPVFMITPSYEDLNEESPIIFGQMRYAGNGGKVLIRLDSNTFGVVTGSKAKTTNASYGWIAMNGADSIEIDGAGYDIMGVPTNTREWTFKTETNAANASVFMLQNDARYITLNNLNVVSNGSGTQGGVLIGSTFTGGKGNDNNTVKNCNITVNTDRVAPYGIVSVGLSAASTNDSIQVLNNEFSNFNTVHVIASTNSGPGWKISGNHFYQNDARVVANIVRAIEVVADATAYGYEISYNYIGGGAKFAGGAAWTYNSTSQFAFINVAARYDYPSVIKGNVIKNFNQSSTAAFVCRTISINRGKWLVSGNKIGGTLSSFADGITYNNSSTLSVIFVTNTTLISAEITDNEISFIRQPGALSTAKAFKAIDYQSPITAYIARNSIHDLQGFSSRTTSVQDGALTGIYITNAVSGNVVEGNQIFNFSNNSSTGAANMCGIGINNGNGDIRNNKIYSLNNNSTVTTVSTVAGMHINAGIWNIYNNQVVLANELFPNLAVSVQGIRDYSTSATASKIYNNSILLRGQAKSTNSYGMVQGAANVKVELFNNIIINNNNMTGGATFRSVGVHGTNTAGMLSSDFNYIYVPVAANAFYNLSTATFFTPDAWKSTYGFEKNSIFPTGLPKFKDTVSNLLLTLDTLNWKLNAAGRGQAFAQDYEGDIRNTTQPDIGADEFAAPMYDVPVFIGGNDTLCAGNNRTLVAKNNNGAGRIYWFSQPYGGDTLAISDTLVTTNLATTSTFYAQVSDTLKRSYRIAVPVVVTPVIAPTMLNLPADSLCNGTAISLTVDSMPGLSINWYDSLNAVTPFNTGTSYNTGSLTATRTYYISTTNNGCTSARTLFTVFVSDTTIAAPSISSQTVCAGADVSWTTTGPDALRWYADAMRDTWLTEDYTFDAGVLTKDTAYWYEASNGRCIGSLNKVNVTVNAIPAKPVIDSLFTVCYKGNITLTATVSGTANWYNDTTATSIGSGPLALTNMVNDTTLFVENSAAGCTSTKVKTTVSVHVPAAISLSRAVTPICFNTKSQIILSKAGSGSIKWFDAPAATTAIATGDSLNTPALTTDKTYYYELNDGLCTGPRDSVTIFVNPFANKPVIAAIDSICFGIDDTLSATATGAVINWYETKTSAPVATGNDFVMPALTGNKKYFAKAIYSGCESDFSEVHLTVRALPQPPIIDSVMQVCRGASTVLKATTPVVTEWYNSSFATTPVFTGNSFATPNLSVNTTYYVQTFDGKCRSEKRPVAVSLRNLPAAPLIQNVDPFCWGDNVSITASSNSLVRWYKDIADTRPIVSDSMVFVGKMFKDTTYYIESYDGFCTSSRIPYTVSIIRYLDGFTYTIPDSVDLGVQAPLSLTGNFDNLYSWNFGAGASTSSATGAGPYNISWNSKGIKNIRLTVTKKVGDVTCDTVITKTVKVYKLSEVLSVETADKSMLKVYPNPASSIINISAEGDSKIASIALYDATGRKVLEQAAENAEAAQVGVEGIAKGIYLLRITLQNNETVTQKVMVQ